MNLVPSCPYCGYKFEGTLSRKDRCPKCEHDVYLRNMPDDSTYRLYSEKAVKIIDKVWEDEEIVDTYRNDLPEGCNLKAGWEKWFNRYKTKADPYEYLWYIFNEWIIDFAEIQDFLSMKKIFIKMAFLQDEQGKESYSFKKEAMRMDLLHNLKIAQENNEKVIARVECSDLDCEQCLDNKNEFTIDEALSIMPIPNKKCAKGSSDCRYVYQKTGLVIE